jgi:tetratricopeptide (TPR) repeat protein
MRHVMVAVLVSVVSICIARSPARADERALAREHYQKGTKAYDLGVYDEAIKEYMEAYRIKDDPAILYNLGQAHRLAGHAAEAIRFYKMYLTKVPRASNRDEVQLKIDELSKLVDQQRKTQNLPPDQTIKPSVDTPTATPSSTTPTGSTTTPTGSTTTAQPEPSTAPATATTTTTAPSDATGTPAAGTTSPVDVHAGRSKKIAGFAVLGVGVAALAAGIALGVTAKSYSDELSQPNAVYDKDKHAQGETFGTVGPALIGVGAAAAVAGAVVAGLGFRDAKRARSLAVAPSVGASHAAVFASIRF